MYYLSSICTLLYFTIYIFDNFYLIPKENNVFNI